MGYWDGTQTVGTDISLGDMVGPNWSASSFFFRSLGQFSFETTVGILFFNLGWENHGIRMIPVRQNCNFKQDLNLKHFIQIFNLTFQFVNLLVFTQINQLCFHIVVSLCIESNFCGKSWKKFTKADLRLLPSFGVTWMSSSSMLKFPCPKNKAFRHVETLYQT